MGSRPKNISASRAAAVLGISPWSTPDDVQREILHPETADEPRELSAAIVLGTIAEDHIRSWLGMGRDYWELEVSSPDGVLTAHLDGLLGGCPVEIKNTTAWARRRDWGEQNTDVIPRHYRVQVEQQMALFGADRCNVWCLSWPQPHDVLLDRLADYTDSQWCGLLTTMHALGLLERFEVRRDPELWTRIEARLRAWWQRHIVEGEPCGSVSERPADLLRSMPTRSGVLELDDDQLAVILEWASATEAASQVAGLRDRILEIIALGDPSETGAQVLTLQHDDVGPVARWDGRRLSRVRR